MRAVRRHDHTILENFVNHTVFYGSSAAPDLAIKTLDLLRLARPGERIFSYRYAETTAVQIRGSVVCAEMIKIRPGLPTYSYCP